MRTLLLLTLLTALCVTAVHAAVPPVRTVHFQDLHLNDTRDVARLYARIEGAANNVCPYYGVKAIHETEIFVSCRATTIATAVARVNDKRLTAYAASK